MLIVVSYDIPDDRRRTRLAHALKDFGERVHYSVFECFLDESQTEQLRKRIRREIDGAQDSVRLYILCGGCVGRRESIGQGVIREDSEVIVV